MKLFKLFTLLCLVAIVFSSAYSTSLYRRNPWFNRYGVTFNKFDDSYYRLFVPCQGGSGSYSYRYYGLPSRWDYRGNYLYIPTRYYSYGTRYRVKTSVYDIGYRVYLKRTL